MKHPLQQLILLLLFPAIAFGQLQLSPKSKSASILEISSPDKEAFWLFLNNKQFNQHPQTKVGVSHLNADKRWKILIKFTNKKIKPIKSKIRLKSRLYRHSDVVASYEIKAKRKRRYLDKVSTKPAKGGATTSYQQIARGVIKAKQTIDKVGAMIPPKDQRNIQITNKVDDNGADVGIKVFGQGVSTKVNADPSKGTMGGNIDLNVGDKRVKVGNAFDEKSGKLNQGISIKDGDYKVKTGNNFDTKKGTVNQTIDDNGYKVGSNTQFNQNHGSVTSKITENQTINKSNEEGNGLLLVAKILDAKGKKSKRRKSSKRKERKRKKAQKKRALEERAKLEKAKKRKDRKKKSRKRKNRKNKEKVIDKNKPLCKDPMGLIVYLRVKSKLRKQDNDEARLKKAYATIPGFCPKVSQVKKFMSYFTDATKKLEFAKFVYKFTYNKEYFNEVIESLETPENQQSLKTFIQNENK